MTTDDGHTQPGPGGTPDPAPGPAPQPGSTVPGPVPQPGVQPGAAPPEHQGRQYPGPGQPPPGTGQPGAALSPSSPGEPVDTGQLVRLVLHGLGALLIILGISLPVDGGGVLWSNSAAWAALAAVAAIAQGIALLGRSQLSGQAWTIGAAAAGTLVLIWTLILLPQISTNMAFMFTVGTACAVAAVWLSPDRKV